VAASGNYAPRLYELAGAFLAPIPAKAETVLNSSRREKIVRAIFSAASGLSSAMYTDAFKVVGGCRRPSDFH
jgi:hypothetical protein